MFTVLDIRSAIRAIIVITFLVIRSHVNKRPTMRTLKLICITSFIWFNRYPSCFLLIRHSCSPSFISHSIFSFIHLVHCCLWQISTGQSIDARSGHSVLFTIDSMSISFSSCVQTIFIPAHRPFRLPSAQKKVSSFGLGDSFFGTFQQRQSV